MGRLKVFDKAKYVSYDSITNISTCLRCGNNLKGRLTGNIKRHYVSFHNTTFDDEIEPEATASPNDCVRKRQISLTMHESDTSKYSNDRENKPEIFTTSDISGKEKGQILLTVDENGVLQFFGNCENKSEGSSACAISRKRKRHILLTVDDDDLSTRSVELAELRDMGEDTTLKTVDDVGWRLIKEVPSLRALFKNTLLMKQTLPNHQESSQISTEKSESVNTSETSLTQENKDYAVVCKREVMSDSGEFLTEGDIINMNDIQNETRQHSDVNDCRNQTSDDTSDINNDTEINLLPEDKEDNTPRLSDPLYEIEKDIKKKELEKMELDVEMKKLELEFMRGRLKEQEMHLKFRLLEYEIKSKELNK